MSLLKRVKNSTISNHQSVNPDHSKKPTSGEDVCRVPVPWPALELPGRTLHEHGHHTIPAHTIVTSQHVASISSTGWLAGHWILTSCQQHRSTAGQSPSLSANAHFKTLLIYKPLLKSIHKTNPCTYIKQNIHPQTSNKKSQTVRPFNITTVKIAHKARTS